LRPDALPLLSIPLLAAKRPLRAILVLAAGIALSLLVFELYYGTALPLPFYAKQLGLSPYDESFIAISRAALRLHVALFALTALPLALLGLLRRDRQNLVLLGAALAFFAYHALATIDVMGMHGRFFAPALPVLALAAARGAETAPPARLRRGLLLAWALLLGALAAADWLPPFSDHFEGVPLPYYLAAGLAAGLVLLGAGEPAVLALIGATALAVAAAHGLALRPPPRDEDFLSLHRRHVSVFRGLGSLRACLGDDVSLYHSEVGVPGLAFPRGRIRDLAGLLQRRGSWDEDSFDAVCERERPEAIFLPHKNYVELNRTITRSRCLRGYARVVTDSSSPLHVRADLLPAYERCARALPPDER
jgi:hypothetical protein